MAQPEWGQKHQCQSCGVLFYDLQKPQPACPKCGYLVDLDRGTRGRRGASRQAVVAKIEEEDVFLDVEDEDSEDQSDVIGDSDDEDEGPDALDGLAPRKSTVKDFDE